MTAHAGVSVVIPCWRCQNSIARAVDSVAAQTERPSEVILVDDASGDGTLERLGELAGRHRPGWIKVIALERNSGPGAARNAGWAVASSPLIAFLDADDAWFPEKLARQSEWMAAHPEAVLTGHLTTCLRDGASAPAIPAGFTARRVSLSRMLWSNRFPTRSVMLRRDVPFRFGDRSVSEDYLLWLELVASGAECYRLDVVMAASFRPDFDPGGWSGHLWRHERSELRALAVLRSRGGLSAWSWAAASAWSLLKFVRRALIVGFKRR
jgi:glycosyltransferase involved in cell wall biosynthesis